MDTHGWEPTQGGPARVVPVFIARDLRLQSEPDMLDGDHMRLNVPDISLSSVLAYLFVEFLPVPSSGDQVLILTTTLDYLSEIPLPAPALSLVTGSFMNEELGLNFNGFIMTSEDLERWTPVEPQPSSPWFVPITGEQRFFKAVR